MKHLCLICCLISLPIFGQYEYRTQYRTSVMGEYLATSQSPSLNFEVLPYVGKHSFISSRFGVGIPRSGVNFPITLTYNQLVNNIKKQAKSRVSTRCRAEPSRIAVEWFLEAGVGYTHRINIRSTDYNLYYGIIGLRQQVVIDIPPKPRVFYLRLLYTPEYNPLGSPVYARDGITITGTSFTNFLKSGVSIGASL